MAFSRQACYDAEMSYNNRREMFPGRLIANSFPFVPASLLEIAWPEAREAPKVTFG